MNYAELSAMQASRAKTFSTAQTDAMAAYCQAEHDLKELQAENAELRELAQYMHRCFVRGHDWGPYCAGETVWVEDRMRESGIETEP